MQASLLSAVFINCNPVSPSGSSAATSYTMDPDSFIIQNKWSNSLLFIDLTLRFLTSLSCIPVHLSLQQYPRNSVAEYLIYLMKVGEGIVHISKRGEVHMKLKLTQRELEALGYGAIESAKRLGLPLKKKKKKSMLKLIAKNKK